MPRDFSWLGSTTVADISPDDTSILFLDGSAAAGTLGAWVRPLDGGEAIRIADGDPGKFSPDGRRIVATSRIPSGPPQLMLVPSGGGKTRMLTSSSSQSYSDPSFAGSDALLFIRSEGNRREVGRMKIDGTQEEGLGMSGCVFPAADPAATRILCIGEPDSNTLALHPLTRGSTARILYALPASENFVYARWSALGDKIFAVSDGPRFLTLDSATGALLDEQKVPLREGIAGESLIGAACSPDGAVQAYSISYNSSRLYLGRGMR